MIIFDLCNVDWSSPNPYMLNTNFTVIYKCEHFCSFLCHMTLFYFLLSVLHENHLTHTDLKPENILFVNSDFTSVFNPKKVSNWKISYFVHDLDLWNEIIVRWTSSLEVGTTQKNHRLKNKSIEEGNLSGTILICFLALSHFESIFNLDSSSFLILVKATL